jgi:anion-transporting  ArsA/GET3 family ATPase
MRTADQARLLELVDSRRLIVCVGPGGVGKTTVAASLGVLAARRGKRTLVLTIDPARRLADALGLDGLDDGLRAVPKDRLLPVLGAGHGALHAAMLDTSTSFDALIRRIGTDPETTRRILENPVYAALSRTLSRSHAHVAMERVYDAVESGSFDLIVLDTPPLRSALEILDAPGRIARFLDDGVVRWFVRPERGRLSRLLPRGGAAASRLLGLLASKKLVEHTTEFFSALVHLKQGFRDRAGRMQEILRDGSTGFVLICAPTRASLEDCAYLRDGLLAREVRIDAAIFNRAFIAEARSGQELPVPSDDRGRLEDALGLADLEAGRAEQARTLLLRLARVKAQAVAANQTALAAVDGFFARLPVGSARIDLPEFERDVRDLPGLAGLAAWIAGPEAN